ncbi:hypothetical protein C8J95_101465 [Elizabethkingia sp. YR214]|uniref:hypothetical protein n=1 Tax=Elizabethkingia sp. YR214 TaxID=2135667 RepID=UPI000D31969E|nr:hypothetical protein [Elizabethkingia sp. YR214]PUB35784.1 hypothetical protein C8J95_101465 [Elizabethkingia sp. YR214]
MKNIDKIFKDQLSQPQNPPAEAWDFIQSALDGEKRRRPAVYIWLPVSGIAAMFLIGIFIFKSNEDYSEKKQETKFVKQTQSRKPSTVETVKENTNEIIQENKGTDYISGIKDNVIVWTKNVFIPKDKASDISETNKVLISQYKNETNTDREGNDNTIIVQQDRNGNKTENKYEQIFPDKNNESDLLTGRNKILQQSNKVAQSDGDKFYVSAFFAPTQVNSFGGKSLLSNDFNNLDIQNSVNMSYGARVSYAINDKIKIRTGAGMLDIEQRTKNVPITVSVSGGRGGAMLYQLAPIPPAHNISYSGDLRVGRIEPVANLQADGAFAKNSLQGDIAQKIRYVEIPLEAEINFAQLNKLGFNATLGASSYVLTHNSISAVTPGSSVKQDLGTATNLNDLSFSANAGIKIDYEVSKKMKLNVEPTFKYMIKPMNKVNDTKPYIIGVSTGVTFSF